MAANVFVNNNAHVNSTSFAPPCINSDDDDDVPDNDGSEKLSPETSVPPRPGSEFSMITSSAASSKEVTRSYKLAQLEQAVCAARILKTNDDQIQFENDCLIAIKENSFDKFQRDYYRKIREHYAKIKRDEETKRIRRFAFVDFEKNYMELYPGRDIKIVFLDGPRPPPTAKTTSSRSASAHPKSATFAACDEATVESFYADCSQRYLHDPKRARREVEKFAHQAARSLAERIPAVSRPTQRVQVVDKREAIGKPNERVLLEMNHKRAMSSITIRRHLVVKMMTQNKKNQLRMENQWQRRPIGVDNPTCYREILERTEQFEEEFRPKSAVRPQTAGVTRIAPLKSLAFTTNVPHPRANTAPSLSSCLTPFQDSLSLFEMESAKKVRVLSAMRPLTAPTKSDWVNYC